MDFYKLFNTKFIDKYIYYDNFQCNYSYFIILQNSCISETNKIVGDFIHSILIYIYFNKKRQKTKKISNEKKEIHS